MKTYAPKPRDIERRWYVLDASGAVLGRLATQAAAILRGKHKPIYAPHADTGDHVIVVNAKNVTLSGGKENKKVAYHHSGYPGGLTETVYSRLLETKPAFAVEKAIKGMLPHNRLGRQMAGKLKVYAGPEHRHEAQKPQPLGLGEVPAWTGLPAPPAPKPTTGREAEAPAAERATSGRSTRKTTAKKTTAKRTTVKRSTAGTSKRSTAGASKRSTSKAPAKKTTAKRTTRSTKKET